MTDEPKPNGETKPPEPEPESPFLGSITVNFIRDGTIQINGTPGLKPGQLWGAAKMVSSIGDDLWEMGRRAARAAAAKEQAEIEQVAAALRRPGGRTRQ